MQKIREVMTPRAEWIGPDLTLQEAAKKMRDLNVGSLPVGEKDRLIGMITDRDITCRAVAEACDATKTTIRDVMSKNITYCFDDQDVADAAHLMEQKHIRRLAVLNRNKRLVGFVSVGDIAHSSRDLAGDVLEAVSQHPCH